MGTQVERIRAVCKERKIAVSKLEKDLRYGNGFLNPKKIKTVPADRLFEIASYLGVSPDYIATGTEKAATPKGSGYGLSDEAVQFARQFDGLDEHGKNVLRAVASEEQKRMDAEKVIQFPATKTIPLLGTRPAAGLGEMDTGLPWEDYEVPYDSRAEFAVQISGDSMEPELHDGQIALCMKKMPQVSDIAVMMVNGAMVVKQFITDGRNVYLRSLNRKRKGADIDIWESGNDTVLCYGIVMLDKRVPLVDQ